MYESLRERGVHPVVSGAGAGAAFTFFAFPIDAMRAQYVTGTPFSSLRPSYNGVFPFLVRGMAVTSILLWSYETLAKEAGISTSFSSGDCEDDR